MTHRAVIFDLDGTLLDSLTDLTNAVNASLREMGFPAHTAGEYRYFIGEGREVLAELSLPAGNRDPATLDRLLELINREYVQHWADHTRPYPGIPALLDELTRRKLRLAVLSNKRQDFTEQNVRGLLSRWHFAAVAGSRPGVPNKPDCTQALRIARRLRLAPAEFLYLGDSGIDMQTAIAAGMYPVGALWGFRDAAELQQAGARALIEQPGQLLELI